MILPERALYVDYLPPLGPYICGIYIPSIEAKENYDLDTFIAPFKTNVWLLTVLSILLISLTKLILLKVNNCYQTFDGFWCLWSSFTAIFGGFTHQNDLLLKTKISYRSTIFVSLLGGTLIWMAYRSCMTAEFNDFQKKYPFTDMESFSKTNWRMVTASKTSATAMLFQSYPKNSSFTKVYENNMDEDSYVSSRGFDIILNNSKTALFYSAPSMHLHPYFTSCKVWNTVAQM